MMPWLYVCLSAYRPYLRSWKCSFSCARQLDDQHGRLAVDQAHQADRPAGHDVGDEQLLAVDDVVVAVEPRRRAQRGQVAAGARLGERERAEPRAAGQPGQEPLLLLGVAERPHRIDRADAAVDRGQPGDGRIDHRHPRQERGERAERRARAAVLLVDQQAPVAGRAQLGEHRLGNLAVVVEQRAGRLVPLRRRPSNRPSPSARRAASSAACSMNSSTGTPRSHTARWTGLFTV